METMSYAQAVGEQEIASGYVYFPGDDFDPYDEDDVAAVLAVGENDRYDETRRLRDENERLRRELSALRSEIDPDYDDGEGNEDRGLDASYESRWGEW